MFRKENTGISNLPEKITYQPIDKDRSFSTYIIGGEKYQRQASPFSANDCTSLFYLTDSKEEKSDYLVKIATTSRLQKEFKRIPKPFKDRYRLLKYDDQTRLLQIHCGIPFILYLQDFPTDLFGLALALQLYVKLFNALNLLYTNGYCHGDLHAGQILCKDSIINIVDFESTYKYPPQKKLPTREMDFLRFMLSDINSRIIEKWFLQTPYLGDFFYKLVSFETCDKSIDILTKATNRIELLAQEKKSLQESKKNMEQKSRQSISCAEFSNIVEKYRSSSDLVKYFGTFRSFTIRNMRDLFGKDDISKKDVIQAIPFWDSRRKNLFNGKGLPKSNGTDEVLVELREAYRVFAIS
jgi:hypothetical protein